MDQSIRKRTPKDGPIPREPAPDEAKLVCYETYAALGAFLMDLAEKGHPQAEKLLDNLSEARLVHADVLPFADVAGVPSHGVGIPLEGRDAET